MINEGNAWASRSLLMLQNLQAQQTGVGMAPAQISVEPAELPGVIRMLERYFELVDADARQRQQASEAGKIGGRVLSEAKRAQLANASRKAAEARSRKKEMRKQALAAAQLTPSRKRRK